MKKEGGDNPKIYLRRRELRAGECEISNQRLPIQNYKNIAALNSRLSGHPPLSPSRDNARRMSVHSHELRIPQPSMFHNRTAAFHSRRPPLLSHACRFIAAIFYERRRNRARRLSKSSRFTTLSTFCSANLKQ